MWEAPINRGAPGEGGAGVLGGDLWGCQGAPLNSAQSPPLPPPNCQGHPPSARPPRRHAPQQPSCITAHHPGPAPIQITTRQVGATGRWEAGSRDLCTGWQEADGGEGDYVGRGGDGVVMNIAAEIIWEGGVGGVYC